ncbi:hypothetical protein [Paludibaculum fermentans]|uniref:Uncharacterized protein n=1 Tax=Paludibaculum fermentans TaxID=1473598 RepID=A0A7S7NPK7_PALFE|nr:hypothetical protein [Paludibaculum fermentans]QOY87440.1 hypothetical protein IRI77_32555 [Paludibaculum fermentans]
MTSGGLRWSAAVLFSFLIYLVPPITHRRPFIIQLIYDFGGLDPFAEGRRSFLIEVPGGFEGLLLPAVLGVILATQVSAALVVHQLLRRQFRTAVLGIAVLSLTSPIVIAVACQSILLMSFRVAEPAFTRLHRPAPERAAWEEECHVANFEIAPFLYIPPYGSLTTYGQVWVRHRRDHTFAVLSMPGCSVREAGLSIRQVSETQFYGATGGAAIFVRDPGEGMAPNFKEWWYVPAPNSTPRLISPPHGADASRPALSANGEWVGWMIESPSSGPAQVALKDMRTGEMLSINSKEFSPDRFWLLGIDTDARSVIVARKGYRDAVVVGFDGALRLGPIAIGNPEDPESVVQRVLLRQGGWIGWYGLPVCNMVEWHLPQGSGRHRVESGTQINSVDLSPNGRLIAIGTDGDYPGSAIESSAVVLDAVTGEELFRKYFPRRCWVKAAFLGNEYLAYSSSPHNFGIGGAAFEVVKISR